MPSFFSRVTAYVGQHGVSYTVRRAAEKAHERLFHRYDAWRQAHQPDEPELARQRSTDPGDVGLISFAIPVYNTKPVFLQALAESLLAQTCPRWEACFYDGMSTSPETIQALEQIAALDPRLRVCRGTANDGISGNTNHAIAMAGGAWIALCDHDDLITPEAVWQVTDCIVREDPDLLYSDEDKITEDGRFRKDPHFKPDFCPDNLCAGNYICHLMVIRKTLVEKAGGLRSICDGSQDHDLALRCSELAGKICHIPRVLYQWREVGASMSHQQRQRCMDAAILAVREHAERTGWPADVREDRGIVRASYRIQGQPSIGIVAVDCGDPQPWARCCQSLRKAGGFSIQYRVVSPDPSACAELPDSRHIFRDPSESIYAALNRAAATLDTDFLLFMYGSVVLRGESQLQELLMHAQRDRIGAVTATVTDHRGRILHGGFAVGVNGCAQSFFEGQAFHSGGWHSLMWQTRNVSAVSAACTMIRRDRFIPFPESYAGGLGAVDWCLRLGRQGLYHICTPYAAAVCTDSIAAHWLMLNGARQDAEDQALFRDTWGSRLSDPCYGPWFSRVRADYHLI